jgi:hypothetical protein
MQWLFLRALMRRHDSAGVSSPPARDTPPPRGKLDPDNGETPGAADPPYPSALEAWATWGPLRYPFVGPAVSPGFEPSRRDSNETERDPDRRGSRRIRLAAALLSKGRDRAEVARITGVPEALLDLISVDPDGQRSDRRHSGHDDSGIADDE